MKMRCRWGARRQNEALQRCQLCIDTVNLRFQPIDLTGHDTERAGIALGCLWCAQIGAKIKQIILDPGEHRTGRGIDVKPCNADNRICLVNGPVRGDAQVVFRDSAAVAK